MVSIFFRLRTICGRSCYKDETLQSYIFYNPPPSIPFISLLTRVEGTGDVLECGELF